jgi:hypothetical protein
MDDISSKLEVISAPENAEKLKSLMAEPFKDPLAAVGRAGADINGTILKPSAAFIAKLNAAGIDKNKSYSSITDYLEAIGSKPTTKISKSELSKGLKLAAQILENPDSLGLVGDDLRGLALEAFSDGAYAEAGPNSYAWAGSSAGRRTASNNATFNCVRQVGSIGASIGALTQLGPGSFAFTATYNPAVQSLINLASNLGSVVNNCSVGARSAGPQQALNKNGVGKKTSGSKRPVTVSRQGNTVKKSNGNSNCMASGDNADCIAKEWR